MAKKRKPKYRIGQFVSITPNYTEESDRHDDFDDAINHKRPNKFLIGLVDKTGVGLYFHEPEIREQTHFDWYVRFSAVKPLATKPIVIINETKYNSNQIS